MKPAAKIITLPRSDMGAPAFTDFSRIFIAQEASGKQKDLLILHEQAHIWLNHRTRRPADFGADSFDKKIWDIALEMEIARNIYTPDDDDEIEKPMTLISGGFTSRSFPKMPPELLLAEDIYEWLKNNPQEKEGSGGDGKKICACPDHELSKDEGAQSTGATAQDIDNVKSEIEKLKSQLKTKAEKAHIKSIKHRKPSLAGEIDYILRSRKIRNRTYARPSRREPPPFLMRGVKKLKKAPRVEIFVDRSGSMSGEKTGASVTKLENILLKYRASTKNDVFYFSSGKIYDHDIPPRGGNPYPLVMAHLEKSRPKIAVIITDYDLEETEGLSPLSHGETKILCVPVCAERTAIANLIGAKDVF